MTERKPYLKNFLLGLLAAASGVAFAATFDFFSPATGILKGSASTYVTTAAVSADIRGLWSGTCDVTTFLRGDGSCAVAGGTGANPTGTIGLTAVNGVATTFLRSDGAPALSQAISPTWSGNHTFSNQIVANGGISGSGASLTALSATQLTTGTVPDGRLSGTYSGVLALSNAANTLVAASAVIGGSAVCRNDGVNCPVTSLVYPAFVQGVSGSVIFQSGWSSSGANTGNITVTTDISDSFSCVATATIDAHNGFIQSLVDSDGTFIIIDVFTSDSSEMLQAWDFNLILSCQP